MLQNAYYVKKGPILARFSALRDAVEFATAITIPEVDGRETDNRVKFKARLPDNLLCYILAISNVVRTKGFPLELSQGLSFETRAKLFSSKLKRDRIYPLHADLIKIAGEILTLRDIGIWEYGVASSYSYIKPYSVVTREGEGRFAIHHNYILVFTQ